MIPFNEAHRSAAASILEFAARPENIYTPGPNARVPGEDPRHVLKLGDLRCVFSVSRLRGHLCRHLSLSQGDKSSYPTTAVVEEVARLFGFQGALTDWSSTANSQQGCLVVVQRL